MSVAPLDIPVHPTQLYSSFALFFIFIFLNLILQKRLKKSGLIFASYLMLESSERFLVDFLRADREMITAHLSLHQFVALFLFIASFYLFFYIKKVIN